MNRETIYNALLTLISSTVGIKIDSRRVRIWTDVAPTDKPSLFLRELTDTYVQMRGMPPKITLNAEVYIYINTGLDPNTLPATQVNTILDAVDVAMRPDDLIDDVLTLGGTVSHCWIEGDILKDPGDIDGEGVIVIPIKILTNY